MGHHWNGVVENKLVRVGRFINEGKSCVSNKNDGDNSVKWMNTFKIVVYRWGNLSSCCKRC